MVTWRANGTNRPPAPRLVRTHYSLHVPSLCIPELGTQLVLEEMLECDYNDYHDVEEEESNPSRSRAHLHDFHFGGSKQQRKESECLPWPNEQPRCPQCLGFTIRRCVQEVVMSYSVARWPKAACICWGVGPRLTPQIN